MICVKYDTAFGEVTKQGNFDSYGKIYFYVATENWNQFDFPLQHDDLMWNVVIITTGA